jgi:hypothetical protein
LDLATQAKDEFVARGLKVEMISSKKILSTTLKRRSNSRQ